MREKIEQAIKKALPGVAFVVERPRAQGHGDYSTNAALVGKMDPQVLADKLKIEGVEKVEVVGKFINFFLSREELTPKEQKIPQLYAGKKIMVEYTDPNPFKEFHIGHLMSNAIGESIARLLEFTGAEVIRANYQGDVGPHVAKTIWAVKNHKVAGASWGEAYVVGNNAYETDEVAKKEIDEINAKIYSRSDKELNKMYDEGRKFSLAHFEKIYKVLGTEFEEGFYFFESETGPKGLVLVQNHPEVFEKSDGAVVFHGEHTRVFVTSRGLPTYESKDLGLLQLKKEKVDLDKSITVTANEQSDYFKVVLAAARRLPEVADMAEKTEHVSHGMMRFAESKMSSRTGNVITGESLIKELTKVARGREDVAVGAIKYTILKQGSNKNIIFDPEKSLSLEGDSGPYLQYALVRARALLRKAKELGVEAEGLIGDSKTWPSGPERRPSSALPLERTLVHYADAVEHAAKEMEPHYVTTYLTELAAAFNGWYAQEKVIGGERQDYGIFLTQAVERTLSQGLTLLGIPTPEEM